jgi:mycofactocin precursor
MVGEPEGTAVAVDDAHDDDTLIEEVLVEEVSIDGMCGVY